MIEEQKAKKLKYNSPLKLKRYYFTHLWNTLTMNEVNKAKMNVSIL